MKSASFTSSSEENETRNDRGISTLYTIPWVRVLTSLGGVIILQSQTRATVTYVLDCCRNHSSRLACNLVPRS